MNHGRAAPRWLAAVTGAALSIGIGTAGADEAAHGADGKGGQRSALLQQQRPLMGTRFTIQLHHADSADDRARAVRAMDLAWDLAERIEQAASDYRADSELTLLTSRPVGQPLELGEHLAPLLQQALRMAELSDGAFDPTVGHLSLLWRRARRQGAPPTADRLTHAMERTGWRHLTWVGQAGRTAVVLGRDDLRLDLGGIGKGYAADAMLELLAGHGFDRAAVAAAGDLRLGRPPPGEDGWPVKLAPFGRVGSEAVAASGEGDDAGPGPGRGFRVVATAGAADRFEPDVRLAGKAVSTSGDRQQFFEHEGRRYSHIIDPRTGLGLGHEQAVIVIAPTATEADALATALNVIGPDLPPAMADHLDRRGCQVWWFEPVEP